MNTQKTIELLIKLGVVDKETAELLTLVSALKDDDNTTNTACVVEEKPAVKETPKLTKEEFLNLDFSKEAKDYSGLDFEIVSNTVCKYNGYVPSDVWTANHIAISQKYGAKWSKKYGGYKFETAAAMQNFLGSYQIKTELTDVDRHNIKLYKQERAKAKAEYYAKKAQE